MRKNKFLYVLLLSVLFSACDKEDNLTPSNLGKDWFTIENSEDPVDRAIYQFYEETGIPVFYNDTIGQETRVDNWVIRIHITKSCSLVHLPWVGRKPLIRFRLMSCVRKKVLSTGLNSCVKKLCLFCPRVSKFAVSCC